MFLYTERVKRITLPDYRDNLDIWFWGDVHRDTEACDEDRWKEWLKVAQKGNPYFIGMGDYHDFVSSKEKKNINKADLHETTLEFFDNIVQEQNRKLAAEIGFMKERLICLVDGNHNWILSNRKTSTEDLAERLNTECVGWLCHLSLIITFNNRKQTSSAFDMVLCHGRAGGKTAGITISHVDDLRRIFPAADIFVMGHDHQRAAKCEVVLIPSQNTRKLKEKRQYLCRSGSFKIAYRSDKYAYEPGRLLRPSDLWPLKVTLRFKLNEDRGIVKHIECLL